MNDHEYDVLDELYFVLSFDQLSEALDLATEQLVSTLDVLHQKGWVRVLKNVDEDAAEPVELSKNYGGYYYLASKRGLLEHNSN